MAPPPPKEEQSSILLPPKFARAVEAEKQHWLVFKVNWSSDWRAQLQGARLNLGTGQLVPKGSSDPTPIDIDVQYEPLQLIPLRPTKPGGHQVVPAGRVEAVVRVGTGAVGLPSTEDAKFSDENVKLKMVPANLEGHCAPLVYWQLGATTEEELAGVRFKCYDVASGRGGRITQRIKGRFTDAPQLRLEGTCCKWPEGPSRMRYLLGVRADGDPHMHVMESDFFPVNRDRKFGRDAEKDDEPAFHSGGSYWAKKNALAEEFGTAKKRRMVAHQKERIVNDTQVANLDACIDDLRKRAQSSSHGLKDEDQELEYIKQTLPANFDVAALTSDKIYASYVDEEEQMAASTFAGDHVMNEILKKTHFQIRQMKPVELLASCKTYIACEVIKRRLRDNQDDPKATKVDSKRLATKLGVLNAMVSMLKNVKALVKKRKKDGSAIKLKLQQIAEYADIASDTQLAQYWFEKFCDPDPSRAGPGNSVNVRDMRIPNVRKLLCHILVWALYLTPKLQMDFKPLNDDIGGTVEETSESLKFIGCRAEAKLAETIADGIPTVQLIGTLIAPLKLEVGNKNHQRPSMKKKKRP
eukprot:gnl/TRDRNA2_/TRDRNA2_150070_c0_seq1.p1 gnl/TRDRNA2_/TRDRNA2_150070_c0~~gnl/TRDRNA2_/TRDRNA2_150070_c0_seq1.p1  ORF type:complete len:589 (+),score=109.05 gnl/TRDRNA2_/TRDRNA2_150070_c0_seq1:25-1767(+)